METIKISQLDALTTPDSNDIFPIVDSSANETKKISLGIIKNDIHDSEVDHLVNISNEVDEDYRVNFVKGKNLLPNLGASGTTNGVSWTIEGNKLTLNGTASADTTLYLYGSWGNETALSRLKAGTYNFNVSGSTAYNKLALWLITRASGTTSYLAQLQKANENGNIPFTLNSEKPITGVYVTFSNGTTFTNDVYYLQVNEGSTATSYEPYVVPSIYVDGEEIYSKPVVLWQNNNVAQAFDGQQITLNDAIENYEFYQVIYRIYYNSTGLATTGRLPIEKTTLFCNDQYNRGRNISQIGGTSLRFGDAYYFATYGNSNASTNNNYIIPYQVIGYGKKATSSSQTRSIPVEEPEENSR